MEHLPKNETPSIDSIANKNNILIKTNSLVSAVISSKHKIGLGIFMGLFNGIVTDEINVEFPAGLGSMIGLFSAEYPEKPSDLKNVLKNMAYCTGEVGLAYAATYYLTKFSKLVYNSGIFNV